MRAITARAALQRKARGTLKRTLVEIDEGHTWLGQGEVAERFLETSYRVMRKYGVAMWMVSQGLEDFAAVKAGRAILSNSALKLLLFHASGHRAVSDFFGLTPRAEAAFRALHRRKGQYSDLMLLYGPRQAAVRLALHPMALWILTTDAKDRAFIERVRARNPKLSDAKDTELSLVTTSRKEGDLVVIRARVPSDNYTSPVATITLPHPERAPGGEHRQEVVGDRHGRPGEEAHGRVEQAREAGARRDAGWSRSEDCREVPRRREAAV